MRLICNVANGVVVVCAFLALLRALDGYMSSTSGEAGALSPASRIDPTLVLVIGVALGALASFNYAVLGRLSRVDLLRESNEFGG